MAWTAHGGYKERLYGILKNMKRRCNNNKYKRYKFYGGKGVKICDEWKSYSVFRKWALNNGYKDNLTIGRIDNDRDYCPSNCRWENISQQANNTSRSVFLSHNGLRMTSSQWAVRLGLTYNQVKNSLTRGYTIEEIINRKPKFKTRR